MAYDAEKQREKREQKKAAGECPHCTKKVVPGKSKCQDHLNYNKDYMEGWRK